MIKDTSFYTCQSNPFINIILFIFLFLSKANAQPIRPDNSFGINGIQSLSFQPELILRDGKLLDVFIEEGTLVLKRYQAAGNLDLSFGGGDGTTITSPGVITHALLKGEVLLSDFRVLRIEANDNGTIGILIELLDKDIFADQHFEKAFALLRYTADGTLDPAFGEGGIIKELIEYGDGSKNLIGNLAIANDGSMAIIHLVRAPGRSETLPPIFRRIYTYDTNGSLTFEAFTMNGYPTVYPTRLRFQGDGKLLIGGVAANNLGATSFLARLSDPSFGIWGAATFPSFMGTNLIEVGSDGKIMVSVEDQLRRFNANGSRDLSFGDNGVAYYLGNYIEDMVIQNDGKIIVSSNKQDGYRLARFMVNGVKDNSFAPNGELANRETHLSLMKLIGNQLFVVGNRSLTKYLLGSECFYTCPTMAPVCETSEGVYTVPNLQLPAGCTSQVSYAITGATLRSGSGNNASGVFNVGESIIKWTINDGSGSSTTCETTVVINARPLIALSGGFALPKGTLENTVYVGYTPASSLNLTSTITKGTAPYQYDWNGNGSGASLMVSPKAATTYTLKVTDANGCRGEGSKKVNVLDIRCGNKMDKVEVCNTQLKSILKGNSQCVSTNAVASQLAHGSYLGSCEELLKTVAKELDWLKKGLKLIVLNNPSYTTFTVVIRSEDVRPITIKVYSSFGILVEQFNNIRSGEQTLGNNYKPGLYYVEVIQGNEKASAKMIKE